MSKSETIKRQLLLFKKINRLFMEGMEKGKSPHDILFKFIMEKPAVLTAFLKAELPKFLLPDIKWDTLHIEPTNLSTPLVDEKRADILFSLQLKSDEKIFFYTLFEHQSTDVYHMSWRFFEYTYLWYSAYIKANHNGKFPQKLPMLFPILLYNGLEKWESPTSFQDLITIPDGCQSFVPHFRYLLKDLSQTSDSMLQKQYETSFLLLKFAEYFKYSRHPNFYQRLQQDSSFVLLFNEDRESIFAIYSYILQTQKDKKPFRILLNNKLKTERNMIDVIEFIREEGKEQGVKEGIQKGRKEGMQKGMQKGKQEEQLRLAKNLLSLNVPLETIAKATGLTIDQINALKEK